MPAPHIPNLDTIARVNDANARFYAVIGVLVSLSAALEQNLFEIFAVGIQMSEEDAASIFYSVRSDEARADMTDAAIRNYLKSTPAMVAEWTDLAKRMRSSSYRNLVAHNPVRVSFTSPGYFGVTFSGPPVIPQAVITHSVRQDPVQVRLKKRPDLNAEFAELKTACEALIQLHLDLSVWLQKLS